MIAVGNYMNVQRSIPFTGIDVLANEMMEAIQAAVQYLVVTNNPTFEIYLPELFQKRSKVVVNDDWICHVFARLINNQQLRYRADPLDRQTLVMPWKIVENIARYGSFSTDCKSLTVFAISVISAIFVKYGYSNPYEKQALVPFELVFASYKPELNSYNESDLDYTHVYANIVGNNVDLAAWILTRASGKMPSVPTAVRVYKNNSVNYNR
jgi:hypothetical protein